MAGPVFIEGCIELLFALVEAAQQQRAKVQVPDPVGAQWELRRALARKDRRFGHYDPVGAQWELWCPLARTDQTLGHHDASARAHVDRRVPPGDRPLGCFSNQNWQQSFGVEVVDTER